MSYPCGSNGRPGYFYKCPPPACAPPANACGTFPFPCIYIVTVASPPILAGVFCVEEAAISYARELHARACPAPYVVIIKTFAQNLINFNFNAINTSMMRPLDATSEPGCAQIWVYDVNQANQFQYGASATPGFPLPFPLTDRYGWGQEAGVCNQVGLGPAYQTNPLHLGSYPAPCAWPNVPSSGFVPGCGPNQPNPWTPPTGCGPTGCGPTGCGGGGCGCDAQSTTSSDMPFRN